MTGITDGFVPSTVSMRGSTIVDRNGFITALAVRALRLRGRPIPAAMLDALQRCRSTTGGFRFWPTDMKPSWAPRLPDDADDTAIMTLELFHGGRVTREEARRIACMTIGRHRVGSFGTGWCGWRHGGVFATWHRSGTHVDLVDCTVTANVLALFAALDLWHVPGVRESVTMLADAVQWAGDSMLRAQSLSPFYPEPSEFVLALEHAMHAGATALAAVYDASRRTRWGRDVDPGRAGYAVCSSPYGSALWRSSELSAYRGHGGARVEKTRETLTAHGV
jgi:hypothetical protein